MRIRFGSVPMPVIVPALLAVLLGCTAAAPWRSRPPPRPAPPVAADRIPVASVHETSSGLTVLVAERAHAPLVSVVLAFRAGHRDDPEELAGLAHVAFHVLAERAFEVDDAAFGLAELPEVVVDADGARITATVLPEDVDAIVARLAHALSEPLVTEAAVARAKRRRAASATSRALRPLPGEATVARIVLGSDDVLARSPEGTSRSRARIGVADVEAFLEANVRPESVAIVLAGPVAPEAALSGLAPRFDAWAAARPRPPGDEPVEVVPAAVVTDTPVRPTAPAPALAPRPRRPAPRLSTVGLGAPPARARPLPVVRVAGGGAPRVVVAVGAKAPQLRPDDEAALRLAEQALGGALRWHLREEAGLAYRVGHRLRLHPGGGLLAASASVAPDATRAATDAARRALHTAPRWLAAEDGMASVRRAAVHTLLDELDTVASLGTATARLFQRDLPPDHYRRVALALEHAPAEDAAAALARLLDPSVARIVVIGGR